MGEAVNWIFIWFAFGEAIVVFVVATKWRRWVLRVRNALCSVERHRESFKATIMEFINIQWSLEHSSVRSQGVMAWHSNYYLLWQKDITVSLQIFSLLALSSAHLSEHRGRHPESPRAHDCFKREKEKLIYSALVSFLFVHDVCKAWQCIIWAPVNNSMFQVWEFFCSGRTHGYPIVITL